MIVSQTRNTSFDVETSIVQNYDTRIESVNAGQHYSKTLVEI